MNNKTITSINDYIIYILRKYPSIKYIDLPYNNKIEKYLFLEDLFFIQPFMGKYQDYISLALDSIKKIFSQIIYRKQDADTNFCTLYNQIERQIKIFSGQKGDSSFKQYNSLSDLLIKIAIICENIYLNTEEKNTYFEFKTSSFDINHVLQLIEKKLFMKGIAFSRKGEETYDYIKNLNNIRNRIFTDYWNLSYATFKKLKQAELDSELYLFYGEALLLIANEYNKQVLNELPYSEW